MKKTKEEIEKNCQIPGVEGCVWRLVKHWNPDGIQDWINGEKQRMTDPAQVSHALGSLMASVVVGFGNCTDNFDDAIFQEKYGLRDRFQAELKAKIDKRRRTQGGVILPMPGERFTQ